MLLMVAMVAALAVSCGQPSTATYTSTTYGFSATYNPHDFAVASIQDSKAIKLITWEVVARADRFSRVTIEVQRLKGMADSGGPPAGLDNASTVQLGGATGWRYEDHSSWNGSRYTTDVYYLSHGHINYIVGARYRDDPKSALSQVVMAIVKSFRVRE